MSYCNCHIAVNQDHIGGTAVSLRCKSWLCPDCADLRKTQLIANTIGGAPNSFLTLTIRKTEGQSAETAVRRLVWAWRCARLRLMRKYKLTKLPFLAVVEKHKSGYPHLHIFLRTRYLHIQAISAMMEELIDSPIVHIKTLYNKTKAAAYAAKYCTKANQKFQCAKRYWQSRDYNLNEKPDYMEDNDNKDGWDIWSKDLNTWIKGLYELDYNVLVKSAYVCEWWLKDEHVPRRGP